MKIILALSFTDERLYAPYGGHTIRPTKNLHLNETNRLSDLPKDPHAKLFSRNRLSEHHFTRDLKWEAVLTLVLCVPFGNVTSLALFSPTFKPLSNVCFLSSLLPTGYLL